jgi:hypothetical protein
MRLAHTLGRDGTALCLFLHEPSDNSRIVGIDVTGLAQYLAHPSLNSLAPFACFTH